MGYGDNTTFYGVYNRFSITKKPQLKCLQNNDLYTTSLSIKGNKALTYPIGLLSIDEVTYAGEVTSTISKAYHYLNDGDDSWTMSPNSYVEEYAYVYNLFGIGYPVNFENGVRPVINLKSTVEITSGDGTSSNPYVIKTN